VSQFRPQADWPLLICGPMLRRVTPQSVAVFAATKEASSVVLKVRSRGSTEWMSSPETLTLPIGDHLHVVVAEMKRPADLPLSSDLMYEYDLELTVVDKGTVSLKDQRGLLTGDVPLGYREGALPSFPLPPAALSDLRLLHGSCRKPHGGGRDAAEIADRLVQEAVEADRAGAPEVRLRPHHLLLTGDQIYADDVALPLLAVLNALGRGLIGTVFPESVDIGDGSSAGIADVGPDARLAPGVNRRALLAGQDPITSEAKDSHLVFFAEYCAMYLMVWSDELWLRAADGSLTPPDVDQGLVTTGGAPIRVDWKLLERTNDELLAVRSFARRIRRVRRAMANIPTMMTIDDHEVTDDWNLDLAWVIKDPKGGDAPARTGPDVLTSIVRNGLLAQAVFQAWGNTPDAFEGDTPGRKLLRVIAAPAPGQSAPLAADPHAADAFLGLGSEQDGKKRVRWDWYLDCPQHRIISLDTRTHRDLTLTKPAGLLTAAEMQRQLSSLLPESGDLRLCFVVSAAPVFDNPTSERVAKPVAEFFAKRYYADIESWFANTVAFERLLRRLAEFGRVVILSGDVHNSFTSHTAYFGPNGERARIVQLCSSPLKNIEGKSRWAERAGYIGIHVRGYAGFSRRSLDANTRRQVRAEIQRVRDQHPKDAAAVFGYSQTVLHTSLMLEPDEPPGEGIDVLPVWMLTPETYAIVRAVLATHPNETWEYQTVYCVDDRDGADRIATAGLTGFGWWEGLAIGRRARTVVGSVPTLGEVRIDGAGGAQEVVHWLRWDVAAFAPKKIAQRTMFTEHRAPLHPPGDDERPRAGGIL
jgi:hypothetical protein